MEKIKLNFDVAEYKKDYNEYMLSKYEVAKEKYKKARQNLIGSLLCIFAFIIFSLGYYIIFHSIFMILTSVLSLFVSCQLHKACSDKKKYCYCDIKLRHKNYEDVMSIMQYTERYLMQPENQSYDYVKLIYDILNNDDYKLLDMSVTYRQSENDYLLKIYYSDNNKVEIQEVLLLNQVTTETDDFVISFIHLSGWLFIPYEKRNELSPDVEYYVDITKLLGSK